MVKTFPLPVHVIALLAFALSRPAPAQDRHVLVPVAELEQMLGSEPLRIVSAEIRWRSRRWWDSSQEELKHQEMFRRIERMIGARMPEGYHFVPNPDEVAKAVLGASTWAVLALTCHIELFVQAHYVESIQPDSSVSPLYKDVFLFHWKDESQHTMLDELEWTRVEAVFSSVEQASQIASSTQTPSEEHTHGARVLMASGPSRY